MASYDYIVVGSGPGGASCAYHLAKALPEATILVLEAGRPSQGDHETIVPMSGYKLAATEHWGYATTPQKALNGRQVLVPAGKIVGGGSVINAMAWHRGPRGDHDRIAKLAGDDAFSYENVSTILNELETFHEEVPEPFKDLTNTFDASKRGKNGPINVSFNNKTINAANREFLDACEQAGVAKKVVEYNGESHIGASLLQWSQASGLRNSAGFVFLDDGKRPANVTLQSLTEVTKIEFDVSSKQVTGVRVKDSQGQESVISAKKDIIVSAGSIGTPRLLQLSGIGDQEQLKSVGVQPIIAHVPAVGKGLQDHMMLNLMWRVSDSIETLDKLFHDQDALMAAVGHYQVDQTGPLTSIASGSVAHVKDETLPKTDAFSQLPKQGQEHILDPTRAHYQIVKNNVYYSKDAVGSPDGPHLTTACWLLNLQSSGAVSITSANPSDKPEVTVNYLGHPYDKEVAKAAVRACLKIGNTPAWKEQLGAKLSLGPKSDSDEDIEKFIVDEAYQGVHTVGTSRIGKSAQPDLEVHPPAPHGAVVDKDFKVFGVQGLRVCDASIIPFPTSAGPQATTYALGVLAARKIAASK